MDAFVAFVRALDLPAPTRRLVAQTLRLERRARDLPPVRPAPAAPHARVRLAPGALVWRSDDDLASAYDALDAGREPVEDPPPAPCTMLVWNHGGRTRREVLHEDAAAAFDAADGTRTLAELQAAWPQAKDALARALAAGVLAPA